jgi:hypothetical protein
MRSSLFVLMLVAASISTAACNKANGPSPTTVRQVDVQCPQHGESTRCSAFALFDDGGQDVTGLATWSTSNTALATVSSTGIVTPHGTGEVGIRAGYRGVDGWTAAWVQPGVGLRGTYRTLVGIVINADGNGPVEDVAVRIVDGPDANRTTATYANGVFLIEGLHDGSFTIRLSKRDYVAAEYVWWIPGAKERYVTLKRSSQ